MKKKFIWILVLTFILTVVTACNIDTSLDKSQKEDISISRESTYSDTQNITENITDNTNVNDTPICVPPDRYNEVVFVQQEPLKEFLAKIDFDNTGKLSKYSTDIDAVILQNGFSEPREIVYERGRDEEGNYTGFEALSLTYIDPELPKDVPDSQWIYVDLRITYRSPVVTDIYTKEKTSEDIEIYKKIPTEYEVLHPLREYYRLKIGEYTFIGISMPNTVTEEGYELKKVSLKDVEGLLPLPYHKKALELYLNSFVKC